MSVGKRCRCTGCCCCLACVSVFFVVVGVTLLLTIPIYLLFPTIRDQQVVMELIVQPGSVTYQQLLNPTVPLFKDIFFFNLTNPDEFQAGAKPNLDEIGPYSYRETRVKNVLNISEDGSLLTYNQTRVFHFSPETSGEGLSEEDTICTINLPIVAAVAQLEDARSNPDLADLGPRLDSVGRALLQQIVNDANAKLYICQPATSLAFNYTDDLVQDLNSNLVLKSLNLSYPRTDVSIQMNNSANNSLPSTINTGAKDISSIGQYVQWQGNEGKLMVWPNGMGANDINGTEGFFFHPFLQEGEEIEVFVDDIYRSLRLTHVDTVTLMGIEAFRFTLVNSTFQSAFTNPENARWGSWNPDGLFYLGPIQDPMVPVYGSKPHFLDGDPVLLEKVDGLSPNRELHESYVDIQPSIGTNVQIQIKLQVNVQVNQSTVVSELNNINGTIYFPILYIDQHTVLTSSFVNFLMDNGLREFNQSTKIVRIIFLVFTPVGAVCLAISLLFCVMCLLKACCNPPSKDLPSMPKITAIETNYEVSNSKVSDKITTM